MQFRIALLWHGGNDLRQADVRCQRGWLRRLQQGREGLQGEQGHDG